MAAPCGNAKAQPSSDPKGSAYDGKHPGQQHGVHLSRGDVVAGPTFDRVVSAEFTQKGQSADDHLRPILERGLRQKRRAPSVRGTKVPGAAECTQLCWLSSVYSEMSLRRKGVLGR